MEEVKLKTVGFAPPDKDGFMNELASRVNAYFKSNGISPYANTEMWIKAFFMLLLYFVPYSLMISGFAAGNVWLFLGLWFIMAWGLTGIGTSVMHDANHSAFSPSRKVNNFIGYILDAVGGCSVTWKIQHNVLHHTYTNISGLDEDISGTKLLRFSPNQPRHWYHRYQHLYACFFYMLLTLAWVTAKDYAKLICYKQNDLLGTQKISFTKALVRITFFKLLYYGYIIVLPVLFSGMPWYYVLSGFLLMHFTSGLFLSCIFQVAHVVPSSNFDMPSAENGKMKNSWALHEIENTTDFAHGNRLLTWFIGGLNYQIEHHLFTRICHVHYPRLSPIVRSVTRDFGLPYNVEPTFTKALVEHIRMLKKLGGANAPC